jgi:hypothetical protein
MCLRNLQEPSSRLSTYLRPVRRTVINSTTSTSVAAASWQKKIRLNQLSSRLRVTAIAFEPAHPQVKIPVNTCDLVNGLFSTQAATSDGVSECISRLCSTNAAYACEMMWPPTPSRALSQSHRSTFLPDAVISLVFPLVQPKGINEHNVRSMLPLPCWIPFLPDGRP